MGRRVSGYVLAVLAMLAASPAVANSLVEVTVLGVRDDQGVVRVALCTAAEFLSAHCTYNATVPAHRGTVLVQLADIPPGAYAAQAWHDENNNGRLDRDFLGIPRRGVGFSNDPALLLGPPAFAKTAFAVGPDVSRASLRLRYFKF